MTDRIEKTVDLKAPIARVWDALSDADAFGTWFRVKIEAPFVPGETARGRITHPGFEHVVWEARIVAIEPMERFAFTWHPYAVEPGVDYSGEPETLVDFRLQPIAGGTRLTMTESGFDALPAGRRPDALRMNDRGWTQQMDNIRAYVGG